MESLKHILLSIDEAAAVLDVSRSTVKREVARGRLWVRRIGVRWKIHVDELKAYAGLS
jgi:excisionase family DNA binding protein